MRKKIVLLMFSCFLVFLFSCSNEQELKPEVKILREDWHRLVNISHVAQNEHLHDIVEKFISTNNLGTDYSLSFSKETIHLLNGAYSQVFKSKRYFDQFLVVNVSQCGDVNYFFIRQTDQSYSFSKKGSSTVFEFDANDSRLVSAKTHYPGNCNALGPPRPGEGYGDCFLRNWTNFCCDFTGCTAQSISGSAIAIAVGIDCSQVFF